MLMDLVLATDHISAGGPWLKYRGHLENISRQAFVNLSKVVFLTCVTFRELPYRSSQRC